MTHTHTHSHSYYAPQIIDVLVHGCDAGMAWHNIAYANVHRAPDASECSTYTVSVWKMCPISIEYWNQADRVDGEIPTIHMLSSSSVSSLSVSLDLSTYLHVLCVIVCLYLYLYCVPYVVALAAGCTFIMWMCGVSYKLNWNTNR